MWGAIASAVAGLLGGAASSEDKRLIAQKEMMQEAAKAEHLMPYFANIQPQRLQAMETPYSDVYRSILAGATGAQEAQFGENLAKLARGERQVQNPEDARRPSFYDYPGGYSYDVPEERKSYYNYVDRPL